MFHSVFHRFGTAFNDMKNEDFICSLQSAVCSTMRLLASCSATIANVQKILTTQVVLLVSDIQE